MEHFFSPILGEDKKKQTKKFSPEMEHFVYPILGEDQKKKQNKIKKKVFSKDRTLFLPDFR